MASAIIAVSLWKGLSLFASADPLPGGAGAAGDVTAPGVGAVAPKLQLLQLRRVAATTTHQVAPSLVSRRRIARPRGTSDDGQQPIWKRI